MARRSFRTELDSLMLPLRALVRTVNNPAANKILDDFSEALQYYRLQRRRRYLIWGLLIGRSVDSFTSFFLSEKSESITNRYHDTFNNRIKKICRTNNPLTRDPTIRDDLDEIRDLRNDLFHNAGRHFADQEMQTFVFNSVKCIHHLIRDL